jgi:thioester reductase-like protein
MARGGGILLTGATGLLGRFLLRDLLRQGRDVIVLARDAGSRTAPQRVAEVVALWSDTLGTRLKPPIVLAGDLHQPALGLSSTDRAWLGRSCASVLHAAAHVGFRGTDDGEPWRSNTEGVRNLVATCTAAGIRELHHVSTAYVCGRRTGVIREDELDVGQDFHNDYERSKCEAERLLRQSEGLRVSVYRPSLLVGDSRSGYTSTYHGIYRFLELADRLAQPGESGRRCLPLRVPWCGNESHNLVPVDWVAAAITHIVGRPRLHGFTYHLTASEPVASRLIEEVATEVLNLEGVSWAGPVEPRDPTSLEQHFLDHVRDYLPYRDAEPHFDCFHTRCALLPLPPPVLDRALLSRLIRFAVADRWGRRQRQSNSTTPIDCVRYVEEFFPEAIRRSPLASVPLDVTIGLDVRGQPDGQWTFRWVGGELAGIHRGHIEGEVVYRLDIDTFAVVVAGRLDVQEAFFARQIDIEGDIEKGLKLATLFMLLVREFPLSSSPAPRAEHATVVPA